MIRSLALSIVTLALLAGLAVAEPDIIVTYRTGVPIVQLSGSYAGSRYTVYRASVQDQSSFAPLTDSQVLCIGDCFAVDYDAQPGRTYFYRFDISLASGGFVSYGPYPVTISPEEVRAMAITAFPNPGIGPMRVRLTVAGAPSAGPVEAEALLFDIRGRVLRTLHRGPLARGVTTLEWDGRGADGREIGPGTYFLRLRSAAGIATTRIVRTR